MKLSRRSLLATGIAFAASNACTPVFRLEKTASTNYHYKLTAEPADFSLIPARTTAGLGFDGQFPAPTLRAKQGQPITIEFTNKLSMPTTIHWHGIRIDNAMDGVPFLTQKPILPGETFTYRFTPPDAGTFWYHPHMHSVEQLGKGLVGILIVEETNPPKFDFDEVLMLKNWHLNDDGSFKPLSIPRYAARMGTPGNIETVNGMQKPNITIPAGGWIRLRLANVDNTVVYKLRLTDIDAYVVAIDANPLNDPIPLTHYSVGAGMRVDIVFKAPIQTGKTIKIQNGKGKLFFDLANLTTIKSTIQSSDSMPQLQPNPVSEPDLADAETKNFVFEWEGAVTPADDQHEGHHAFWMINRRAWDGMDETHIPEPLAILDYGKTYIFDLRNNTPHQHPIHLHGVMFKVLKSDKKKIIPHFADTVLMEKNERVQIAFVADNIGHWMYHCHVIEHMKTGLMGYITIRNNG